MAQPQFRSDTLNIFTDEQEQWIGEAQAAEQEASYDLLPQKDSAELERIGQKLLAQLPPTSIHYSFRVYESEDANAFSFAGGHVYVSRKLITDARSEDEVAAVLSHEIGHIYTHQVVIEFTREFKAMLNVTTLGDQKDIVDKFQLSLNAPWKERAGESEDDQEKNELLADRVGIYALIKAGYAPRALSENLDRIAVNKGHTGSILTDVLGTTSEINRRVRVARKIANSLPQGCGSLTPTSSPEFRSFQEAIRNAPIHPLVDPTPDLSSIKLEPPMRPALTRVRFSPDGSFILAQDESSIHVLSRSPLKHLFTIDALGARFAQFTPDSTHVVFHYPTMRVENWDVVSQKLESFHELVDYNGCLQTSLSPDGKTFVCLSKSDDGVWLKLSDVDSGKIFYENKTFSVGGGNGITANIVVRGASGIRVANVACSQDSRTLIVASAGKAMAFDLKERKPIPLVRDLTRLIEGRIAFIDSNKLAFECDWEIKAQDVAATFKICEASFPEGEAINEFKIGYQWMEPITRGNSVVIGPFKDNAAMLTDPSTGKASAGFKMDSLDLFDRNLAIENERGGITVGELGGQHMESVDLPVSTMSEVEDAAFSPDGRFLAYSSRARSSIWDLQTQQRVALMRPFRAVRFNDQHVMLAQYSETHQRPGQNFQVDLKTGKATEGAKFAIDQFQKGDVLVTFQPQDKSGETTNNVVMQVADAVTGAPLWSKRYPHDVPLVRQFEDGTLLLTITINSDTAADEIKHNGNKLLKSSDWRGEWVSLGLLVEIVDSHTGEIRRVLQVPEKYDPANGDSDRWASLFGDYLVVHGVYNNSVIYRASDGTRLGAFFGRVIAGDGKLGLLAATNRDQEVFVLNADNGLELKRITVDERPCVARFIPDKPALLVLTSNQRVYSVDLPSSGRVSAAPAN